jgi:hypothetical protein
MSFYAQTTRAIQRAHTTFSHTLTAHSYEYDDTGGENAYADGDWIESTTEVSGTVRTPDEPTRTSGPDGTDVDVDVEIYVQPDDVSVDLGVDDETKATEFTDSATGRQYRVRNIRDQHSLLALDCEAI